MDVWNLMSRMCGCRSEGSSWFEGVFWGLNGRFVWGLNGRVYLVREICIIYGYDRRVLGIFVEYFRGIERVSN